MKRSEMPPPGPMPGSPDKIPRMLACGPWIGRAIARASLGGTVALLAMTGTGGVTLVAQAPTTEPSVAFDVASVKPNRSTDAPYSRFPLGPGDAYTPGGVFSARNQPLVVYVRFAFKLPQVEVSGLPDWAYAEAFDIEARARGNPTKDEMRRMMISLLVNRFQLVSRVEQRAGRALALVLATEGQLGPQLQAHSESRAPCVQFQPTPGVAVPERPLPPSRSTGLQLPDIPCRSIGLLTSSSPALGRIGGRDVSMARIAAFLTNPFTGLEQPVTDETGLGGTFDFALEWALAGDRVELDDPAEVTEPTIRQALREQLGLRLESTTAPVSIRVIDRIERPSPD